MIGLARPVGPFTSPAQVFASHGHWVVVERATGRQLLGCRIRYPREGGNKDAVLTVRVEGERRYVDICWIKPGGELLHKGRWTGQNVGRETRYWRLVKWLWERLQDGRIPSTVEIWPDGAFERERCRTFESAYPDVWRALITQTGFKRFNENKLELIKRFGWLTDKEIASIRSRKVKSAQ